MSLLAMTLQFCSSRIRYMNEYENVTYNTIEFKNKFGSAKEVSSLEARDILVSNYTFMPSLDTTMTIGDLSTIEDKVYKDVFLFNEDYSDYHFNLDELKRYVKFYVKILSSGSELPKQTILRSDLVPCTKEMFKNLDEDS